MRRLIAYALVSLAACGESPGAYLTIKANGIKGLTQVAVYIGNETCEDPAGDPCGIAPMGGFDRIRPMDPGGTWFRDSGSFTAGMSGGETRVRIQPSGKPERVQVIVLGLDIGGAPIAAKVVRDLDIPANDATSVTMTLDPADAYDGNIHPTGTFFERWSDPLAVTDCVLVERWDNGQRMDTFIVPEDDGDCDGIPTLDAQGHPNMAECDPYWFHEDYVSSTQSCAEGRDMVAGALTCLLGGQGCKDGSGPMAGTCLRNDPTTCVPQPVCTSTCQSAEPGGVLSTCVDPNSTAAETAIRCKVFATSLGGMCNVANPSSGTLILDSLFTGSTHHVANGKNGIAFAPVDSLYPSSLDPTRLRLPSPGNFEVDVTGQPDSTMYPDVFGLQWSGVPVSTVHGVADITIDNGDHMRLPVIFELGTCTGTTTSGITCSAQVGPGDQIVNCALDN